MRWWRALSHVVAPHSRDRRHPHASPYRDKLGTFVAPTLRLDGASQLKELAEKGLFVAQVPRRHWTCGPNGESFCDVYCYISSQCDSHHLERHERPRAGVCTKCFDFTLENVDLLCLQCVGLLQALCMAAKICKRRPSKPRGARADDTCSIVASPPHMYDAPVEAV